MGTTTHDTVLEVKNLQTVFFTASGSSLTGICSAITRPSP